MFLSPVPIISYAPPSAFARYLDYLFHLDPDGSAVDALLDRRQAEVDAAGRLAEPQDCGSELEARRSKTPPEEQLRS